jgi:hypothetical protein
MDYIYYKKIIVGFRLKLISKGSLPITEGSEPLQVVTLKHSKGAYLKAHMHAPRKRQTDTLQECLIVVKGKVKLDIYGPNKKFIKYIYLSSGEMFLLMNGGIGIHVVKDAEMIEVKNGPFKEDKILI